ncbi:MAG: DUF4397 domain-containing protein [Ignavibacteriae bacterium]|nr:DUF4397 domain-containing protein [Ignavibacteriota bacterium]
MISNQKFKSIQVLLITVLTVFSLSLLSGCDEDNPVSPATPQAFLTVVHASPNAPNVDIYYGSSTVATDVPYLSRLAYIPVNGNSVTNLKINAAGTSTTVIDTALYMQENKSYTVFVYDSLASIKPLFLNDDLSSPGSINANVRFLHLSPNGPTVDVGVSGKTTPWFAFESFSQYTSFRPVTGQMYDSLNVYPAGTPTVIYTKPNVNFEPGRIYTIIANGFVGGTGTQAFGLTIYPNN